MADGDDSDILSALLNEFDEDSAADVDGVSPDALLDVVNGTDDDILNALLSELPDEQPVAEDDDINASSLSELEPPPPYAAASHVAANTAAHTDDGPPSYSEVAVGAAPTNSSNRLRLSSAAAAACPTNRGVDSRHGETGQCDAEESAQVAIRVREAAGETVVKTQQEAARIAAEQEAARLAAEEEEAAKLAAEQEAARIAAEEEEARRTAEAAQRQGVRIAAELEAARLAAEEEEAAKLAAEQEAARIAAEEEEARRTAEAAQREAARIAAEQEAARIAAEEEEARRTAEAAQREAARIAAEQEAARLAAEEEEAAKLAVEQEAARIAAEEEEARRTAEAAEQEAARIAAEQEAARLAAEEEEAAKLAAEQEAARIAAEEEEARRRAEAAQREAVRIAAEQEAARLAAEEEEAAKLAVEQEAARIAAEEEEARRTAEAAQREAARIAAEQEAARPAAEEEEAKFAAEQEAARIAAEEEEIRRTAEVAQQEAARISVEQEASRIVSDQEPARLAAEKKAVRFLVEQEVARVSAGQAAERKAADDEEVRRTAETTRQETQQEAAITAAVATAATQQATKLAATEDAARIAAERGAPINTTKKAPQTGTMENEGRLAALNMGEGDTVEQVTQPHNTMCDNDNTTSLPPPPAYESVSPLCVSVDSLPPPPAYSAAVSVDAVSSSIGANKTDEAIDFRKNMAEDVDDSEAERARQAAEAEADLLRELLGSDPQLLNPGATADDDCGPSHAPAAVQLSALNPSSSCDGSAPAPHSDNHVESDRTFKNTPTAPPVSQAEFAARAFESGVSICLDQPPPPSYDVAVSSPSSRSVGSVSPRTPESGAGGILHESAIGQRTSAHTIVEDQSVPEIAQTGVGTADTSSSTHKDANTRAREIHIWLEELVASAHIDRDEGSYVALLQGYRMALEEGIRVNAATVSRVAWVLRNFSDYLVPPPHSVARSAARRAHNLAETAPDLSLLNGAELEQFMIQCNIEPKVAQFVAVDENIDGQVLVNCTIENFKALGINITDAKLQKFRDAILAYWDKRGGGIRRVSPTSSRSSDELHVGARVAVFPIDESVAGAPDFREATVTAMGDTASNVGEPVEIVEVVFDDNGLLETVSTERVARMTDNRTGTEFRDSEGSVGSPQDEDATSGNMSSNERTTSPHVHWVKYTDEVSGEDYWFNSVTRESQWNDPTSNESLRPFTPPLPTEEFNAMRAADNHAATDSNMQLALEVSHVGGPTGSDSCGNPEEQVVLAAAQELVAEAVMHGRDAQHDQVDQLMELGFSRSESVRALVTCDGDLTRAATFLVDGGDDASTQAAREAAAAAERAEASSAAFAQQLETSSTTAVSSGALTDEPGSRTSSLSSSLPERGSQQPLTRKQSRGLLARARELSVMDASELHGSSSVFGTSAGGRGVYNPLEPEASSLTPSIGSSGTTFHADVGGVEQKFDLSQLVKEARKNLAAPSTLRMQLELLLRPYGDEYGDDPGNASVPTNQLMDRVEARDPFLSEGNAEHRKQRQERQRFRRSRAAGKNGGWTFRLSRNCTRSLSQYETQLRQAFDARKLLASFVASAIEFASKEWDLVQVLLDNWGLTRHTPFFHRRFDTRMERLRNLQQLHHHTATLLTEQLMAVQRKQEQVSQVPAMVADFDRWASSFFRSPEELFARQIVTLELRNMIDGSNGRLHEMDSVAAMLEKELAPRPPSLRAEQFMDIALQTKQWSKPEAELHKMFREILVDTRTMHGQVMEALLADLLSNERRDTVRVDAIIEAFTEQLVMFIDAVQHQSQGNPLSRKKAEKVFFGSGLLASLSKPSLLTSGNTVIAHGGVDSGNVSANSIEMRRVFRSLVEALIFPFLYQRMSAKTEAQLDAEWRHIYVGVVRGFELADFAPSVAAVFDAARRTVCYNHSVVDRASQTDVSTRLGSSPQLPLQSAIEQLNALFMVQRVPATMAQSFALLCQTIVNDVKSAWLAAKSRIAAATGSDTDLDSNSEPLLSFKEPKFPGLSVDEFEAVLAYCLAQAKVLRVNHTIEFLDLFLSSHPSKRRLRLEQDFAAMGQSPQCRFNNRSQVLELDSIDTLMHVVANCVKLVDKMRKMARQKHQLATDGSSSPRAQSTAAQVNSARSASPPAPRAQMPLAAVQVHPKYSASKIYAKLLRSKDALAVLEMEATIRRLLSANKLQTVLVTRQNLSDGIGMLFTKTRKVCYGNVYLPIYVKATYDGTSPSSSALLAAGLQSNDIVFSANDQIVAGPQDVVDAIDGQLQFKLGILRAVEIDSTQLNTAELNHVVREFAIKISSSYQDADQVAPSNSIP